MARYKADTYAAILREELIPSLGCTEPSSIAFTAAKARETLGHLPDRCVVEVSGNMIKNAKSVTVPNTEGMKGIPSATAAGIIAGKSELGLEALQDVTADDLVKIKKYLDKCEINVIHSDTDALLYIAITVYGKDESACVVTKGGHLNVFSIEKNGEKLFQGEEIAETESYANRDALNIADIFDFAKHGDITQLKPIIARQIEYNYAISKEGLDNNWGANVGKIMLKTFGDELIIRAVAAAAAGSDARMSGCDLPVIIVSGSGNQGITTSVPVIEFAKRLESPEELLYRALILANLVTVHQKAGIGRLSAFCGAVSAGCGAAAGIAFLLGGDYDVIAHTIVNALAITSGMVCDGAKPSCAAKIAVAVHAGLLGYSMYAEGKMQFFDGDGIVQKNVDNTIANVARMANLGMRETDREILRIMTEEG